MNLSVIFLTASLFFWNLFFPKRSHFGFFSVLLDFLGLIFLGNIFLTGFSFWFFDVPIENATKALLFDVFGGKIAFLSRKGSPFWVFRDYEIEQCQLQLTIEPLSVAIFQRVLKLEILMN